MKTFSNRYSILKTLRFSLNPIGKTLENINSKGLISKDQQRELSYKKMKNTIDDYHKFFIETCLTNVRLKNLEEFAQLYNQSNPVKKKDEVFKKSYQKAQEKLRKEIVKSFREGEAKKIFSKLDKKELFSELLEEWRKSNETIYFDEEFKNFFTYFTGFNKNRANMYSAEEKSTAIAYRLIHENLPKFLDNSKVFKLILEIPQLKEKCKTLYSEIEKYLNITIEEAFELEYFNKVLTQTGIDVYNLIIGGRTASENTPKKQGLNEYINLYNQKQEKKNHIPKLKVLYKQILSDRVHTSFLPDKFENSTEVINAVENLYKTNLLSYQKHDGEETESVLEEIKKLVEGIATFDISKIYLRNDASLTNISKTVFGDWSIIKSALEYHYTSQLIISKKRMTKKQVKEKEHYLTKQSYYSIAEIEEALYHYKDQSEVLHFLQKDYLPVANYFKNHFYTKMIDNSSKVIGLIANIEDKYRCIKGICANDYPEDKDLKSNNNKDAFNIKLFLDSLMEFLHFVKPLVLPKDTTLEKDEHFYTFFNGYYEELLVLISLYNKVRNYITQKPYSVEKFKLNFENSTLLAGWDANREEANTSVLFLKDDKYYLGIMDKDHNKIFREVPKSCSENVYQKVNYKLLPGANKMLPKVFFSAKNISFYNPNEDILRIRNHGTHSKGGQPQKGFEKLDFNLKDCRTMIDFFKKSINKHEDWKNFNFKFSDTQTYMGIDDFYREVEVQGYSINYTNIDEDYLHQLVDEGKLYLFQIYNKDFSKYSKGKKNIHTVYWEALFDPENLKDAVYKLNGKAEIFYRKKSVSYDEKIMKQGHHYEELKNKFNYPIIKDKRFTEDKFLFHVPITLNFKSNGTNYLNYEVLDYLKGNPDVNIIGIDRGERHLLYLSVINQNGEVLKDKNGKTLQFSLNDFQYTHNGEVRTVDYKKRLQKKEDDRALARQNWGEIENIKELKEGYLSLVVHRIAKLMIEYNAIVVLEDLNFGFKRGRFKVEKQVYQKFEKMLIDKLNYLVFKDKAPQELGGIYKALQLTNKLTSFKEIGKQCGFLFYVPAWNTSKIDPTTGFVNLFNTKYETLEKAKEFFAKFKSIRYNAEKKYFEWEFDYNDFTEKAKDTRTNWTLCSYGNRILNYRNTDKNNQWDTESINLTEKLKAFFNENDINIASYLKEQILEKTEAKFFKDLYYWLKITLQMRNSNDKEDYLISPVQNAEGTFYDSNNAPEHLPQDADANGAYHIAKKGLWILEQIEQFNEQDDWKKLNLVISNKKWLQFVQNEI